MKKQIEFKRTEIGIIPEEWDIKKVEKFCEKITSGGTPSRRNPDYWKNGTIPWLKTQELLDNSIYRIEEKITELGFKNSSAKLFPPNTVIIAMYGATVGKLGILKVESTTNQACCAMIPNENISNYRFLFYALLNFREKLINLACGAAQQNLNQDIIKSFYLPFPSKMEQDKIASILGSLDDKIALNRSMNSTLEAIGQALFKHWFVDFEFPNEEGKPYRSSGGEMVETELGEVPKGWRVGSILECADLLSGGTPKTEISEYWDGDILWVSAKDVTEAQGSFVIDTERKITQTGIDNSSAKLLPKNTTVVTARGTVGSYCILSREMAINQTNYGLKAKSGIGDFFIFFSISNLVIQMKQNAYGTIFDTITTKTFKEMKISIPPESMVRSFDNKVNSLISKILHNLEESYTLATIRDALLPKLMSGEIRVSTNSNLNNENK